MLESIKQQLQQKIHEAFEHLCVLQDLRQTVLTDLQNKNITLDIDVEQYNMNVDSGSITFKPDPTRRPKKYARWLINTLPRPPYCMAHSASYPPLPTTIPHTHAPIGLGVELVVTWAQLFA